LIKTIFLDRDGIINDVVLRDSKVESPRTVSEFKIRPEFINFYKEIDTGGFNLFVISNQPDIARNKMDIKELEIMTEQLNSNFSFKEISYCIHDDSDNCNCRKPKPGMIINLLDKHNLQKEESILVGDSSKDISAGKNAGIKTVVLQTDYNRDSDINSDFEVGSLTEIIRIIKE
jgi:D-glycero-D-manno-heptose 1,7-bisphosphate phosphatase